MAFGYTASGGHFCRYKYMFSFCVQFFMFYKKLRQRSKEEVNNVHMEITGIYA